MTRHLSEGTSGALRTFAGWVARGTVGHPLVDDVPYWDVLANEPTAMEQIFAIFANVLELDDHGEPTNARHAEHRAAVYLYRYCTGAFLPGEPDLEGWECAFF